MKLLQNPLLWLVLFFCSLLVGCASPAKSRAMVGHTLPQAATAHDSVIVVVEGGEKTHGTLRSLISNGDFSTALIASLQKTGLFKSVGTSGDATFRLETTLEDLAQPKAGASMTVTLQVDWRLIRISDTQVLWHDNIFSTNTVGAFVAFSGVKRIRLATEGAARTNIEQGLSKLAVVNF